ncbi:hypothetical protein BUALT_Bualt03G0197100 [Buddleja alternifolia]|uniref:Late embryogenesis abundant protein LEA-2 subgroup domain-containing protein n=1 Tax=Buddleja alternifolia TaxID=168488 RepID=A0AAV6Y399_9LAMI|nr:hypothetical protein BUALT_Bualt03G0197100 [Buddleja alternifolia]
MGQKACCICCLLLLLAAPIIIFALSFVTHKPRLYIEDFYIPALNNSTDLSNTTRLNTFIFIDLKLENVMPFNGLRYDDVNLTFFYGSNRSLAVANHTVSGFYQGLRKTAHKRAVVRTHGLPWEVAFAEVSGGETVSFRVDLATAVKLRRCGVYTKRKTMALGADVRVDSSGEETNKKTIRLIN